MTPFEFGRTVKRAGMWNDLGQGLTTSWNNGSRAFKGLTGGIGATVGAAGSNLAGYGMQGYNAAAGGLASAGNAVNSAFGGDPNKFKPGMFRQEDIAGAHNAAGMMREVGNGYGQDLMQSMGVGNMGGMNLGSVHDENKSYGDQAWQNMLNKNKDLMPKSTAEFSQGANGVLDFAAKTAPAAAIGSTIQTATAAGTGATAAHKVVQHGANAAKTLSSTSNPVGWGVGAGIDVARRGAQHTLPVHAPTRTPRMAKAGSAAFLFGQYVKQAFELAPKPPGSAPPAPSPAPAASKPQRTWNNFWTGTHNPSNPTAYDDYRRTMSRYVSPWNQDTSGAQGKDQGNVDTALKWGTRAALGTGAAAGTAAAGVAAAAPTLAATPVSSLPAYFAGNAAATGTVAGAGAGGAAASQNPTAQQMFPTIANTASTAANAFNRATTDVAMRANDLKSTLWDRLPHPAREFHETLEHHPFAQALDPNTGIAKHMNPVNTSGNLMGLLPHSVTLPYEGMHEGVHGLEHTVNNFVGGGHGGVAHAGMH
jgi:hypothetical protein